VPHLCGFYPGICLTTKEKYIDSFIYIMPHTVMLNESEFRTAIIHYFVVVIATVVVQNVIS
jgi:hypothetical protein